MRYEITVNRDAIDKKVGDPIRVLDTKTGEWFDLAAVRIIGDSVVRFGPHRQNGATVWIECDRWVPGP